MANKSTAAEDQYVRVFPEASVVSEHLNSPAFQKSFQEHWHASTSFKTENLEVIAEPFRLCKISNFLKDREFIRSVKEELRNMNTSRTDMDLYQFVQTSDFKDVENGSVKQLRNTFLTEVSQWMQINTGIELNDTLSMSSSLYELGDYLLCHDDNNEDRALAFILYLTEGWSEEDGGQLALFDTDEHGQPRHIVKKIVPEFNALVFFQVTHNSYHQVLEVLAKDKARWSINGWFHGPIVKRMEVKRPKPVLNFEAVWYSYAFVDFWLNKEYLDKYVGPRINHQLDSSSVALLANFLRANQFLALCDEVRDRNIRWTPVGPPDVRNYEVADIDTLPNVLRSFVNFLKSETFLVLLNWFTECDIVPDGGSAPRINVELQKWTRGSYKLIDPIVNDSCDTCDTTSIEDYFESDEDSENDQFGGSADNADKAVSSSRQREVIPKANVKSRIESSDEDEDDGVGRSLPKRARRCSGTSSRADGNQKTDKSVDAPSGSKMSDSAAAASCGRKSSFTACNNLKARDVGDDLTSSSEEEAENGKGISKVCDNNKNKTSTNNHKKHEDEYCEDVVEYASPLVEREQTLYAQQVVRNYEIAIWMMRFKKVVIPFKEDFRELVSKREDFFKFIFNDKFDLEEGPIPQRNAKVVQSMRKNFEAIRRKNYNSRETFDQEIDALLKIYAAIESGELKPEAYKDCGYDVVTEDPYRKIVEREIRITRNKRLTREVEQAKMPNCSLELMMPFNALKGEERQYANYVDPKNPNDAILISVPLKGNCLSVVYKEKDICRVHKYLQNRISHEFYNLVVTYHEKSAFKDMDDDVEGEDADCESNEE